MATQAKGPIITATSQQSRFYVDTTSTLSTEVDLKQVNIAIGSEDLLVDAHVRFKAGVRYGLVGRNGEGKSTLLHAIGNKIIPGVPDNLRILLVDQIEGTDPFALDDENRAKAELSVTARVVSTDKRREMAMREHRMISQAFESGDDSDLAHAIRKLELERSQRALEDAQKIALKRSGARGKEARKNLLQAEANLVEAEERARSVDVTQSLVPTATSMLEEIQSTLDAIDAASTEARAQAILIGLGFTQDMLTEKFSTMSGGWRSRCSLASALLQQPDILLLDECTNYLDLFSVIWLTEYLNSLPCTVVVVAHDRDFLDSICEEIIMLKDKQLHYYNGNLTTVEREQKKKRKSQIKQKAAIDRRKGAIEKTIAEGAKRARKTGDETLQRQVKSRQKKLDERWGLERNDKGHRFKLNRDFGGYAFTARAEIQLEELEREVTLPFPDPEPLRFPGALISATDLSFRYSSRAPVILSGVTISIHPGSRVALVGRNGEGKSTLVKLLTKAVKPTTGKVEHHPRLRIGSYDQHSVESLSTPEFVKRSPVEHFIETLKREHNIEVDEPRARAFLGSFGLKKATNPISTLSGGQKVRLALALVVYPAPDCLVLDEVSTHLDLYTVAALVRALRGFYGAVILVTHDRHLVRTVVEGGPLLPASEAAPDDDESEDSDDGDTDEDSKEPGIVYMVGKGTVKQINGVDEYVALVEKRVRRLLRG